MKGLPPKVRVLALVWQQRVAVTMTSLKGCRVCGHQNPEAEPAADFHRHPWLPGGSGTRLGGGGESPDLPCFVSQCWCPHIGQVQRQPPWAQSRLEGTGNGSGGPGQRDVQPAPGGSTFYCQLPALWDLSTPRLRSTQQGLVYYMSHSTGLGKWVAQRKPIHSDISQHHHHHEFS